MVDAMRRQAVDPFQGAVERRVMSGDMDVFDLEERAARAALADAGTDPQSIDLLLTHTVVPEYLLSNPACILHERLGLARSCLSLQTEAATYAFTAQLSLAEAMIAAGRATSALLVQSCGASRVVDFSDPASPLFGDGATAVVVGPVGPERGILSAAHFTDGRFPHTLVASPRGASWYHSGPSYIHVADPVQMTQVLLSTADVIKQSVEVALARAGIAPQDVDLVCMHQGTPWLRSVVQEYTGMRDARSVETFSRFGYLFAAILPAALAVAKAEGALSDGDVVVLCGGGTGMTYGATVLRWETR